MQDTMHLRAAVMKAADVSDMNEAVKMVQDALGVETGDIATMYFSGYDQDSWERLDADHRSVELVRYATAEMTWLLSYGAFDKQAAA